MQYLKAPWSRIKALLSSKSDTLGSLVARAVSGSFLLKIWYTLYSFVVSVALARMLGADGFGNYSIAISWVALLVTFAKLGLDQTTTRYTATYHHQDKPAEFRGMVRFSIMLALLTGVGMALVAALVLWWLYGKIDEVLGDVLLVSFLLVPIQAVMAPLGAIPQGMGRVVRSQLPSLLVIPLVYLLLLGLLLVTDREAISPFSVMGLMVIAHCVGVIHSVMIMRSVLPDSVSRVVAVFRAKEWLASAIPVTLMGGMYVINMNADIVMLGALSNAESAGVYKAATRGADIVMLPSAMISLSLAPIIARLHAEGDARRLQRGVTKTTRVGLLASAPLALLILVFDERLLELFGEGFSVATTALWILVVAQLVKAFLGPVGWLLVMTGNEKMAAFGLGVSVVLNLVLNALLIPAYGVNGAAVATMTSTVLGMLILGVYARRILGIDASALGMGVGRSRISG